VAARLQESSPGGYLRESLLWGLRPRGSWVYVQKKVYCNVLFKHNQLFIKVKYFDKRQQVLCFEKYR
jgi:hypothetical protein